MLPRSRVPLGKGEHDTGKGRESGESVLHGSRAWAPDLEFSQGSTRFYLGSWHTEMTNGDSFFPSLYWEWEFHTSIILKTWASVTFFSWHIYLAGRSPHRVFLYWSCLPLPNRKGETTWADWTLWRSYFVLSWRWQPSPDYLQVIGQVVLLQRMCFKTMRGCVKVIVANATDEAFRLWKQTKGNHLRTHSCRGRKTAGSLLNWGQGKLLSSLMLWAIRPLLILPC